MNADVNFRPDFKTPEPAVMVYRRDGGGKPHASWFDAEAAELAIKAAALMGMQVLTVETAEQRQLVERFARGRVFASGRAFTPFVREKAFAELLKMAETAIKPTATADGSHGPAEPASAPSDSALAPPPAEPPSQGAGTTAAPTGVPKPTTWEEIGTGSIVLAHDPGEGRWESLVVGARDEFLSLRWRDYPKLPLFTRRRNELALLPPATER